MLRTMSERAIEQLHKSYRSGTLRVLVGAGTSIPAGFPAWDRLCLGLLEAYLRDKYEDQILISPAQLGELAKGLLSTLGRDAAADFVRVADPERWHERLADALYEQRAIDELPVLSTHCQLAALARHAAQPAAFLYTTNYDPLIELALAYLAPGSDWQRHRRAGISADSVAGQPLVHHVHGWIDPDGDAGGTVVLTESHYLELQRETDADPNRLLHRLLKNEGALLIVGMSLADPNLRRLLYHRKRDELLSASQRVYVVLKRRDPVLDGYLVEHWRSWRIDIVLVDDFDDVPGLLREVAWGREVSPAWLDASRAWMRERIGDVFWSDAWQALAHNTLKALEEQISVWFALPQEERVQLSLFVPTPTEGDASLCKVASSRTLRTGEVARRHALARRLGVARGAEQGVAGVAFARGTTGEVLDDDEGINLGFSKEMVQLWDLSEGYRAWRSILSVPVLDSPAWLPTAVINVTSNFSRPFWATFEERERSMPELEKMLRRAVKWLLVDHRMGGLP
jgi:hypothetical protein